MTPLAWIVTTCSTLGAIAWTLIALHEHALWPLLLSLGALALAVHAYAATNPGHSHRDAPHAPR